MKVAWLGHLKSGLASAWHKIRSWWYILRLLCFEFVALTYNNCSRLSHAIEQVHPESKTEEQRYSSREGEETTRDDEKPSARRYTT